MLSADIDGDRLSDMDFNRFFEFPDYSAEELTQVFLRLVEHGRYQLDPAAAAGASLVLFVAGPVPLWPVPVWALRAAAAPAPELEVGPEPLAGPLAVASCAVGVVAPRVVGSVRSLAREVVPSVRAAPASGEGAGASPLVAATPSVAPAAMAAIASVITARCSSLR